MLRKILLTLTVLLGTFMLLNSGAFAQLRERPASPVINKDGSVTFRLKAPEASAVSLSSDIVKDKMPMKKDSDGVWSVTLKPSVTRIYNYSFLVDGVLVIDPQNPEVKLSLLPNSSMLNYPGNGTSFWDEKPVPHGIVHYHRYNSKSYGSAVGYYVYTPPGYNAAKKYPVLYLLHGYSDNESGWTAVGKANFILDNLIAEGKAVPMVVVMPFGYSKPYLDTSSGDILDWIKIATPLFETYFFNEVVTEAEKNYNVSKDPSQRAIAGLSMGGCQSLYIGLKNPGKFAYVAGFSSAIKMDLHGALINNPAELNSKLKLLWIGCGKDDFLFKENTDFMAALDAKNIKYTKNISEGIHTWWVWRDYLKDVAGKLFK